jgi:ribosomal protein S9
LQNVVFSRLQLAGFRFSRYKFCNRLQSYFRVEELEVTEIGIGILGGGYMGNAHAVAMSAVGAVFDTALRPRLEMVCANSAKMQSAIAPPMGSRGPRMIGGFW